MSSYGHGAISHGHTFAGGASPTYTSWRAMKSRCTNPDRDNAKHYVDRGISYDPRWDDFAAFLADMGVRPDGLTLDRIDNDIGYSKGNCRWATPLVQRHNRRPHEQHNRGEGHPLAKLTTTKVQEIRSLKGKMRQDDIAGRFGVTRGTIGKILRGDRWASLGVVA